MSTGRRGRRANARRAASSASRRKNSARFNAILGLAGLIGAGRTEIARAIFGADAIDSGTVTLEGEQLTVSSPRDAIKQGIYMIPESRKEEGLILEASISDNMMLSTLKRYRKGGSLSARKLDKRAVELAGSSTAKRGHEKRAEYINNFFSFLFFFFSLTLVCKRLRAPSKFSFFL